MIYIFRLNWVKVDPSTNNLALSHRSKSSSRRNDYKICYLSACGRELYNLGIIILGMLLRLFMYMYDLEIIILGMLLRLFMYMYDLEIIIFMYMYYLEIIRSLPEGGPF